MSIGTELHAMELDIVGEIISLLDAAIQKALEFLPLLKQMFEIWIKLYSGPG